MPEPRPALGHPLPADTRATARATRGFTLIELIVVISIMSVLAAVAVPALTGRVAKARDARRLEDLQTLVRALDDYLLDNLVLPDHDDERGQGGWDTTLDGAFISELVSQGYLHEPVLDPLNDRTHHYRYQHYEAGEYGIEADFYVLGILNFETEHYAQQTGQWKGDGRDWGEEFAYVVGGLSR